MAGEGFYVADIHEPLDEFEAVVEFLAGLEAALNAEGEE